VSEFTDESPALTAVDNALSEMRRFEREAESIVRSSRYALQDAQQEIASLRAELVKAKFEWFTEEAAAAALGVSTDFLAGLRKQKKIPVVKLSARVYRHTSSTLVRIAEMLEVKPKPELAKQKRRAA